MDWGLLRSTEPGKYALREKMKYGVNFYYFAMTTNAILRFFWVVGIFAYPFNYSVGKFFKDMQMIAFLSVMAEVIRRTQWALIRVENEFYNNFEHYRTIPTIPNLMEDEVTTAFAYADKK